MDDVVEASDGGRGSDRQQRSSNASDPILPFSPSSGSGWL
jgi:hypothetical protein